MVNGNGGSGRVDFVADDPTLTPHAGLEVSGELVRRIGLVERVQAAVCGVRWPGPVKQRRRGLGVGGLVVSVAESIMCGAECWDDLEDVRSDLASRPFRAVANAPASSTARQRAARFRRSHLQAVEQAAADAAAQLDAHRGLDVGAAVTLDMDGTDIEVYGAKQGAARGRGGMMGYTPHLVSWAERGRVLTAELYGANHTIIAATDALRLARRAIRMLPAGHGPVTVRVDAGSAAVELMAGLRAIGTRFSMSMRRTGPMWRALDQIAEGAWQDAIQMRGAQVAEIAHTPTGWTREPLRLIVRRVPFAADELLASAGHARRRRRTIAPGQIELALAGELGTVHGYSFIVTDVPGDVAEVERFHRQRAQIEDRIKEAKLGQALRHMPCKNIHQNRFWMTCCLLALNITSLVADLTPANAAQTNYDGNVCPESPRDRIREDQSARRAIKTVRRWILDVPGRVVRTGRRTTLRLPAGYRHHATLTATYTAVLALPPP